jgi:hypothetical protein
MNHSTSPGVARLNQVIRMWREGGFTCDFRNDLETPQLSIYKGPELIATQPVASWLEAHERAMALLEVLRSGRLK